MATEQDKAELTKLRGRQAAQISDPDEKKAYIAGSANVDKDYEGTAEATALKGKQIQARQILGSMKKGGKIPQTGLYKLHKGEKVVPANKVKQMEKKAMDKATEGLASAPAKPKRVKKTVHVTIEPTDNKGFVVRHNEHRDGMPSKSKTHSFAKASDMHKHIMKTYPASKNETPMPEEEAAEEAQGAGPAAPNTNLIEESMAEKG